MAATDYMALATLVTASEVANATMTGGTFDINLINDDVIQIAELAHVREPMGHDFYDFIKTNMALASGTRCWDGGTPACTSCQIGDDPNDGYEVWVENYLKPALCWFVKFEALNDIQYNSTSAGIQMNMPEYSEPVDAKIFNAYKQDVYRKAKVLLDIAIEFLNDSDNDGCFEEYDNIVDSEDGYDCEKSCNGPITTKNHGMIIY